MTYWRFSILLIFMFAAIVVKAQRPKLDLRLYGGYNTHVFVYKEYEKSKDVFHGWQGGFGFRVSYRNLMGEVDFNFIRNSVLVAVPDTIDLGFDKFEFRYNAFQLPLKAGIIPIKKPAFKLFLYTGPSFRFNTKGKIKIADETFKIKPREIGLNWFNLDWCFGSQIDFYGLNFEILYSIGVTNSLRENIRTNSHLLLFNFGIHF